MVTVRSATTTATATAVGGWGRGVYVLLALMVSMEIITIPFQSNEASALDLPLLRISLPDDSQTESGIQNAQEIENSNSKLPEQKRSATTASTPEKEESNNLGDNRTNSSLLAPEKKRRSILFVHVGKASGMTVRKATGIKCKYKPKTYRECLQEFDRIGNTLGSQLQMHMHLDTWDKNTIKAATSYLFSLRNPVDRIASAYKYNHPDSCPQAANHPFYSNNATTQARKRTGDCGPFNKLKQRNSAVVTVYEDCFPSSTDMEPFAQSTLSPWNDTYLSNSKLTFEQKMECRRYARTMVDGRSKRIFSEHMTYNYNFYAEKTIQKYPTRELFGVRQEDAWGDLASLDRYLGGRGQFPNHGSSVFHGRAGKPEQHKPLSAEANHKLCCVLEQEIEIYMNLVHGALNFNSTTKQHEEQLVKEKCGIVGVSWVEWRTTCREHLEKDDKLLGLKANMKFTGTLNKKSTGKK